MFKRHIAIFSILSQKYKNNYSPYLLYLNDNNDISKIIVCQFIIEIFVISKTD